ncbi:2,3-bisphosphoglycerate-independent phosphoglycerate mutase [Candidatus Bathyarchaeota archaeon]|nr:2,3-bisphosphoglycerate-independent phosphoglycerate mutase [Candidatus Bathyarchaeota archaeon]
MGDLPIEELSGKTPLEYAETPNMDFLASIGRLGLMYTVGRGIAPESDVAVISILGYDPYKYHVGRGPLEAYGSGLNMRDGDLALRCNFATLGPSRLIIDRRAGRNLTTEEASKLAEAVNKLVRLESYPADFEFKNTIGHRGVLVIRSKAAPLSGKISNTDPAYERVAGLGVAKMDVRMILEDCIPLEDSESARISAALVNEFVWKSHEVLDGHEVNRLREAEGKLKANVILTRDAGNTLPKFFNINEWYGVRFACLADMPVERGIARLAGMRLIELPPPSGDLKHDCLIRAEKLLSTLEEFDCFYIHIKGPDEPGHDGDFMLKAEKIAIIDRYFFGSILDKINLEDVVVCVTADHSTPCKLKAHSDTPVPVMISGDKIKSDGIKRFSERYCQRGSLGTIERGTMLMPILMETIKAI